VAATTTGADLALETERAALDAALGAVAGTVAARSPLPVASTVLLVAEGDTLVLRTTNLDQETTYTLGLAGDVERPGTCAVAFGLLRELVREVPAKTVRLAVERGHLRVTAGGCTANLKLYPADEFPPPAAPTGELAYLEVRADVLRMQVERVAVAAATDDSRPALNGVLVRLRDGALALAAADGFRLASAPDIETFMIRGEADAILPLRAVKAWQSALAARGEHAAFLRVFPAALVLGAWPVQVTSRVVEGTYPNYPEILARTAPVWEAAFAVDELQAALRAETVIARDGANIVRLAAGEGGLVVTAVASEVGDATVLVPAELSGASAGQDVAANLRYLTDVLRVIGTPRARIRITSPSAPILLEPVDGDGYQHVVMPMAVHR
jgi:DNA polymerase-3 subunit beta